MEILTFHHCNIQVRDLDEATKFYRDVLGLRIREEDSSHPTRVGKSVWFDIADKQLHVTVGKYPEAMGQHFAIQVRDIEAVAAELAAAGVEVPDRTERGVPGQRRRYLKVSDPSGNMIEILQDVA